jgi:hypothetical protein
MDLASVLIELSRRKLLVALAIIPSAIVGILLAYHVSLSPPGLYDKSFEAGAASVQFLVDSKPSSLGTIPQPAKVIKDQPTQITPSDPLVTKALVYRAQALARLGTSDAILDEVSRQARVPRASITAQPPPEPIQSSAGAQTAAQQRAGDLVQEGAPYRILFQDSQASPSVAVFVQAPDAANAQRVAQAVVTSLRRYVRGLDDDKTKRGESPVRVIQLGLVQGGTVTKTPNRTIALAGAVLAFIVFCLLIALASRTARRGRFAGVTRPPDNQSPNGVHDPDLERVPTRIE